MEGSTNIQSWIYRDFEWREAQKVTNIQSWIYRDFEWREAQIYKVGFIGTLNGGKHKK